MMGAKIVKTAKWLPQKRDEFKGHSRFVAVEESAITMLEETARLLLEDFKEPIDAIVCFSGMPDFQYPKDVNILQQKLGLDQVACYTIDTACASFISALNFADLLLSRENTKTVMILQAMHWLNRGFSNLQDVIGLGDGASGMIIAQDHAKHVIRVKEKTYSEYFDFITLKGANLKSEVKQFNFDSSSKHRKFLVKHSLETAKQIIENQKVDWFIPHQINAKIMKLWARGLGLSQEQVLTTFDQYANMSAVNIPMTIHEFFTEKKKIRRGETALLFAPGAGMHVASMVYRF